MNTFFTADHHFGHRNIINHCKRPFGSQEEMDRTMIDNWNNVVAKNDVVFHLGDFCFMVNPWKYLNELNGLIHLIPGTHDKRTARLIKRESKANDTSRFFVCDPIHRWKPNRPIKDTQRIVLCHYSMRVWQNSCHGAWHLYGHSHGKLEGHGLSFDVGVDAQNFTPISIDEVCAKMKEKGGKL